MSILIHWYLKYIKEGLEEPNEVRCATNKYKEENDKFNDFFDQVLEESKYQFACFKDIYAQFQSWWIFNYPSGKKYPDESNLKRALKMKFGEEQTRIIQGVKNKGFNVKIKIDMLNEDDLD
jgi:phage/plasmid-associated DNA primase